MKVTEPLELNKLTNSFIQTLQTPFRTIGIREPYVRKLLFGRALWVTFLTAVIVAVLTVIFTVIPGHRL